MNFFNLSFIIPPLSCSRLQLHLSNMIECNLMFFFLVWTMDKYKQTFQPCLHGEAAKALSITGVLRCLPLFKDSLIMNICKSPLEHKKHRRQALTPLSTTWKKRGEKKKQATGIAFNESCAFQTALVSYKITIWEAIYDSTKFLCVSMRVQSVPVMEQNEKPALLVARN